MSQPRSSLAPLIPRTMPITSGDSAPAAAPAISTDSDVKLPESSLLNTSPNYIKARLCSSTGNTKDRTVNERSARGHRKGVRKSLADERGSTVSLNMTTTSAPSLACTKLSSNSFSDETDNDNDENNIEPPAILDNNGRAESPLTSESEVGEESDAADESASTVSNHSLVRKGSVKSDRNLPSKHRPKELTRPAKSSSATLNNAPMPAGRKSKQNLDRPLSPSTTDLLSEESSQSTICDKSVRSKMHKKQKCKAAKDGAEHHTDRKYTSFFRELRENLHKVQESDSSVSLRKDASDAEEKSTPYAEISMYDMFEFVCKTLRLVNSWIAEVPLCCRQRLCRCDAFVSFFCAEFYKHTEILVSEELFAFIFWHVLEQNGSPREYDLEFLKSIFEKAKEESWSESWKRCPLSSVFDHLSHFLKCQNEKSSESVAAMDPAPMVVKAPSSVISRTAPISKNSPSAVAKSTAAEGPSGACISAHPVAKAPSKPSAHPKLSVQRRHKSGPEELKQDSNPGRAMSLESLSGALSNTQLPKSPSKVSTLHSIEIARGSRSENVVWRENVDELNSTLAIMPSKYPKPHSSRSSIVHTVEHDVEKKCKERLSSACSVLYKTGRRNLLRMLDFALTEFFMQSPNLSCCIITSKGPILVHDTLLGTKCTHWTNIRKNSQKWANRYCVVDLRKEQIPMIGLWTVIEYVYNGSFTVTAGNVFESQKAGEFFGVPLITDACLRLLNCLTSSKMVCHTVESLRQQQKQNHPLWTLALGKLIVCFDECRNDKIMVKWPLDLIVPILEQPELCTKDEVNVYNFAVRWVEADFPRRRAMVPQIMNTIRFVSMPADTLLFISSHAKILDGHPELRQEIADLHLKVRMESSGFEIPPEMDWSIPRRTRRVPTAAKGYGQSGRDLNVLMLYFCPRAPRSTIETNAAADDVIPMLKRYLKICMKFVFIDEDGALSRNWLYCGPPKPELREIIRLRQKDLKKRQVWNQTAADLNGQSATIGTEGEPDEDNCDNLSTKTRKSTDMSGRRDPRCMDAIPGTAFENILKYLSVLEPELPAGAKKEGPFDATYSGKRLVDNLCVDSTTRTVADILRREANRPLEKRRKSPQADETKKEVVRKTEVEVTKTVKQEPSKKAEETVSVTIKDERFSSLPPDVNSSSSFLTDWIVDDEKEPAQPKKWYLDLAEKMNILNLVNLSRPQSGDSVQVYPAASSISVRSRDLDSPLSVSSKHTSPNRKEADCGDVGKVEANHACKPSSAKRS